MNHCIKCGKEIPEGELFCLECSLNAGSTQFDGAARAERHAAPKGRMQTPVPVKRAPVQQVQPVRQVPAKKKSGRGAAIALVIISLLLALSVGYTATQYGNLLVERNRLRTKEADLSLRQSEIDDLYDQLKSLTVELDEAKITIAAKEEEIQDLTRRLAASQSSQNQGAYDLTTAEQELARLQTENRDLLEMTDELDEQITELKKQKAGLEADLKAASEYKTKADFMDAYVVFVENNGSGYYHTYDCTDFTRSNFWAYSRKLAEAQGFAPCPTCGGRP